MKNYLRKIPNAGTRRHIVDISSDSDTPSLARHYKLTISEMISLLKDEGGRVWFKRYGSQRYNWKDPNVKSLLKHYIDQGLDDDQIAHRLFTTCPTITRARSTCGFVKFHRAVGKGHSSPHVNKHIEEKKDSKKEVEQLSLGFYRQEDGSQIMDKNENKPIYLKGRDSILITVDKDLPNEVKRCLVDYITWKEIAEFLQNPHSHSIIRFDKKEFWLKPTVIDTSNSSIEFTCRRIVNY